jgi:hypothetical protein
MFEEPEPSLEEMIRHIYLLVRKVEPIIEQMETDMREKGPMGMLMAAMTGKR